MPIKKDERNNMSLSILMEELVVLNENEIEMILDFVRGYKSALITKTNVKGRK